MGKNKGLSFPIEMFVFFCIVPNGIPALNLIPKTLEQNIEIFYKFPTSLCNKSVPIKVLNQFIMFCFFHGTCAEVVVIIFSFSRLTNNIFGLESVF